MVLDLVSVMRGQPFVQCYVEGVVYSANVVMVSVREVGQGNVDAVLCSSACPCMVCGRRYVDVSKLKGKVPVVVSHVVWIDVTLFSFVQCGEGSSNVWGVVLRRWDSDRCGALTLVVDAVE